jgi:hypothetical protein
LKNVVNHIEQVREQLIRKVGPWAFQSYPKSEWISVSDRELISGALLRAKPEDRYLLLQVFDLNQILQVWKQYAVPQDKWFHSSNVWAAEHLFKQSNPERFVKQQLRKSRKLHLQGSVAH